MYDIEHIYLFDKRTVSRLLQNNGYDVIAVRNTPNSYTLSYALKMFPLPGALKRLSLRCAKKPAWPLGRFACRPATWCPWAGSDRRLQRARQPDEP